MIIIDALFYLYLITGTLYALYVFLFAGDPWYSFPINVAGGPLVIMYLAYITLIGRRLPWQDLDV